MKKPLQKSLLYESLIIFTLLLGYNSPIFCQEQVNEAKPETDLNNRQTTDFLPADTNQYAENQIEEPIFFTNSSNLEEPIIINLGTIIELLENNNLDINLAKSRVKQSKDYYWASYAPFLPSFSAQFYGERVRGKDVIILNEPVPTDRNTLKPGLTGDYNFSPSFKHVFRIKLMKNQVNKYKNTYDRTFQTALYDAVKLYISWYKNYMDIEQAKQSLKEAEEQLKVNELRMQNGFGTKLDVMQSKALFADRQNVVLNTENQKSGSEIDLITLLNLPVICKIQPEKLSNEEITFEESSKEIKDLLKIAETNRADIKALNEEIKMAKSQLFYSVADLVPDVQLRYTGKKVGSSTGDLDTYKQGSLYINLDVLKYMGLEKFQGIKANREKINEAVLSKQKALNDALSKLYKVYKDCGYYKNQLQVNKEKLSAAEEGYRIADARYKVGFGINLEVMQSLSDLSKARLEYQKSLSDSNTAQIELLYELGILTPDRVLSSVK